jgi:hypothetical protein
MGLTLHSELGINPRRTKCPQCGKAYNELLLLGNRNWYEECACGNRLIGYSSSEPCPKCHSDTKRKRIEFEEGEIVPTHLCEYCRNGIPKEWREALEQGGILFKCKTCKLQGVISGKSKLAEVVRLSAKRPAPLLVGYEFECCLDHTQQETPENASGEGVEPLKPVDPA